MRTVKYTPVALSGSLSLHCRLQFARHCRPNWKQCNVEVGTPSSLSPRCRWPCIFSFKCCLCERKRTGLLADRWLHRAGSPRGFEVNLMGTTLSTNQLQQKCARWLFNFLGEESAPRPVMCEGAQHPMQNRLQMRALCGEQVFKHPPLRKRYKTSHWTPDTDRSITDPSVWLIILCVVLAQRRAHRPMGNLR